MNQIYNIEKLVALRRELHTNPELSGKEVETHKRLKAFLSPLNADEMIENLGGNGLALVFKGKEKGKKTLFRADIDALPITEKTALAYASQNAGVAHVCGHDGHSTILAGLAMRLAEKRPQKGEVILLFQPAEETGEGAQQVIDDPKYEKLKPNLAFALHNLPGFDNNTIIIKRDTFAAASVGLKIKLHGRTAHASQPETGLSPAFALAEIIKGFTEMAERWTQSEKFKLLTLTYAKLGEQAFGTAPGEAECWMTIRSYEDEALHEMEDECVKSAKQIADRNGIAIELSRHEPFAATVNDAQATAMIEKAAEANSLKIIQLDTPFKWSEDFGQFGQCSPIALFGIGSGLKQPALHNPDFNFPDSLIDPAVDMFEHLCRQNNG
ncbi:MAG: amidohydrolase [Bacteroidetes bacterium]|nr:amidohydrolase [Bacteroidota bacterium]MBU1580718.1 amidohydrolase [Bacteroidota bacterium]MBU2557182.1 amidohydrolase [Bacteroidota bacterium]